MNKNRWAVFAFTLIAIVCYFIYQETRIPDHIIPMGDDKETAWMSYYGGAFAMIAAVIGVIREVVGLIRDVQKDKNDA